VRSARMRHGRDTSRSTAWDREPEGAWHQATAFPHPQFDPDAFFLHDAGVLELQEPAPMSRYGALPEQGFLDQFQTARRAARPSPSSATG
jgi:hypothetical protein